MTKIIVLSLTLLGVFGCAGEGSEVCARPSPDSSAMPVCVAIQGVGCPGCENEADLWSAGVVMDGSSSTMGDVSSCSTTTYTTYGNGDSAVEVDTWSEDGSHDSITLTVTTPSHTCTEYIEVTFY